MRVNRDGRFVVRRTGTDGDIFYMSKSEAILTGARKIDVLGGLGRDMWKIQALYCSDSCCNCILVISKLFERTPWISSFKRFTGRFLSSDNQTVLAGRLKKRKACLRAGLMEKQNAATVEATKQRDVARGGQRKRRRL